MAKSSNQKLKTMYIARILMEKSDEEHPISTKEIIEELEKNDIKAERKSIYSDIEVLINYGLDIIKVEGKFGGYYLGSRSFELAELKLLVDAVQASKFITGKKSRELIAKLENLTSKFNAKKLQRQVVVTNRNKAANENIYYSIDEIYTAMNQNKKIRFQYFSWTATKEAKLRKNGDFYEVSPWFLTWEDENYYLIAYDDIAGVMKHYRVDKMLRLKVANDLRTGRKLADAFDIAAYSKKTFGMFAGEEQMVTMICDEELTGVLIDRFGKEIALRKEETGKVKARAEIAVSPQFFGWITGIGKGITIVSPGEVKEAYASWLAEILKEYQTLEDL